MPRLRPRGPMPKPSPSARPTTAPRLRAGSINPPGTPAPRARAGPSRRASTSGAPTRSSPLGWSRATIRSSPSPPPAPPLSRNSRARAAPRARPVRRGRRRTAGASRAISDSNSRPNRAPSSPTPRPIGTAQSIWSSSGGLKRSSPRANCGWPPRLLVRAARAAITIVGQIRRAAKEPARSSAMNSTPTSGVLKPAANPTPPAAAISSRSDSPASRAGQRRRRAIATAAPSCTTGPSRPSGSRARVAIAQRHRRSRVGPALISAALRSGSSRHTRVWGKPEPAPAGQRRLCSKSNRGIAARGASIRARLVGPQPPPKAGNLASSRPWARSIRLRGQQARPTRPPSRASCNSWTARAGSGPCRNQERNGGEA